MTNKLSHRDIFQPFADPFTNIEVRTAQSGSLVVFQRNSEEHRYFFEDATGKVAARHISASQGAFPSVRSLLASPQFADIKSLIHTQRRLLGNFTPDKLLEHEASLDGQKLSQKAIEGKFGLSDRDDGVLRLLIVDGPAGIGKTSLLKRMVHTRAHSKDATSAPILHVSSRGKRLSSLDDILAYSLQIIRAKFHFDQIPVLAKLGLLQVAIDGFDELVDADGFKDAWLAMRDFLEKISTGGPVILAGRDSFFDQKAFKSRMGSHIPNLEAQNLTLYPTTTSKAKDWLLRNGWNKNDVDDPYTNLVLRKGSYSLRPYFLSELASTGGWSKSGTSDRSARQFLIDRFLDRESNIISDKTEIEETRAKEGLTKVFGEVALEMRDTESDSVDLPFLELATEVAFTGIAKDSNDLAKLKHRSESFALMEVDQRPGFRRFPHTEISNHFLARALVEKICSGDVQLPRFLRRSILQADFLLVLGEVLFEFDLNQAQSFLKRIGDHFSSTNSVDSLPGNLLSILLCGLNIEQRSKPFIANGNAVEAACQGYCGAAEISNVTISRFVVQEADLSNVKFIDSHVEVLVVDDTTRFGPTLPRVQRLVYVGADGSDSDNFAPEEIEKWLRLHSTSGLPEAEKNERALKLLEKVARTFVRQHQIKKDPHDQLGKYLFEDDWGKIERVLQAAGIISEFEKDSAGKNAPFLRMNDPYGLIADRVRYKNIWDAVAAI